MSAWALGASNGGVVPPAGTSGCSPWSRTTEDVLSKGPPGPNGVPMNLFTRVCDGVVQGVWVPVLAPEDLARLTYADLSARLVVPVVAMSPSPARGGVVNLVEWLAVEDPGVVSVSAAIPGLSVTTSATASSVVWDMGNGDRVPCTGLGERWAPGVGDRSPACGYRYAWYSADRPGDRYAVSVTLVWKVSWLASDGRSGVLGDLSTVYGFGFRVGELQTVAVAG